MVRRTRFPLREPLARELEATSFGVLFVLCVMASVGDGAPLAVAETLTTTGPEIEADAADHDAEEEEEEEEEAGQEEAVRFLLPEVAAAPGDEIRIPFQIITTVPMTTASSSNWTCHRSRSLRSL